MNSNGILTLSVNPNGQLSLWNSTREALAGKGEHDVIVAISLTRPQMLDLLRAERLSISKKIQPR